MNNKKSLVKLWSELQPANEYTNRQKLAWHFAETVHFFFTFVVADGHWTLVQHSKSMRWQQWYTCTGFLCCFLCFALDKCGRTQTHDRRLLIVWHSFGPFHLVLSTFENIIECQQWQRSRYLTYVLYKQSTPTHTHTHARTHAITLTDNTDNMNGTASPRNAKRRNNTTVFCCCLSSNVWSKNVWWKRGQRARSNATVHCTQSQQHTRMKRCINTGKKQYTGTHITRTQPNNGGNGGIRGLLSWARVHTIHTIEKHIHEEHVADCRLGHTLWNFIEWKQKKKLCIPFFCWTSSSAGWESSIGILFLLCFLFHRLFVCANILPISVSSAQVFGVRMFDRHVFAKRRMDLIKNWNIVCNKQLKKWK